MTTHILPFATDVELKTYQFMSFPLGMIKANLPDYELWLCENFINCVYQLSWGAILYEGDIWAITNGLTSKEEMIFTAPMLKDFSLIEFNKEQLLNNKYIIGFYDESCIPGKWAYGSDTCYHDYVIFGFDDKKGIFKSAGYLKEGEYTYFDIKYEDYYNATVRNTMKTDGSAVDTFVAYCGIHAYDISEINISHVKENLSNYFYSRRDKENSNTDNAYGLAAWNAYSEYILCEERKDLDIRFSSFYMEHIGIMYKRIKTLYEHNLIQKGNLADEYFENIYLNARMVHRLDLKYMITKKSELRQKMAQVVADTTRKEKYYMEQLLTALS